MLYSDFTIEYRGKIRKLLNDKNPRQSEDGAGMSRMLACACVMFLRVFSLVLSTARMNQLIFHEKC